MDTLTLLLTMVFCFVVVRKLFSWLFSLLVYLTLTVLVVFYSPYWVPTLRLILPLVPTVHLSNTATNHPPSFTASSPSVDQHQVPVHTPVESQHQWEAQGTPPKVVVGQIHTNIAAEQENTVLEWQRMSKAVVDQIHTNIAAARNWAVKAIVASLQTAGDAAAVVDSAVDQRGASKHAASIQ